LPHLQKIAVPSVECVHNVASALDTLAQRMAQAVFRRFPQLQEVALMMTQNIIQREKDTARKIVEEQVRCHCGYLFTNDPVYLIEHGSMEPMYKNAQASKPKPQEEQEEKKGPGTAQQIKDSAGAAWSSAKAAVGVKEERRRQQRYSGPFVQEIRKRLDAYFFLTVRNARDSVPKAIGYYLVRAVLDKIQFELLQDLNKADKIEQLLGEPPHILEERRQLTSQMGILSKASNVLSRDPTLAAIAFEAEEEELVQEAEKRPAQAAPKPAAQAAPAAQQRAPAPAPTPAPAAARPSQAAAGYTPKPQESLAPRAAADAFAAAAAGGGSKPPAPLFNPTPGHKPGLFDEGPADLFGAKKPATKNPLFGDDGA